MSFDHRFVRCLLNYRVPGLSASPLLSNVSGVVKVQQSKGWLAMNAKTILFPTDFSGSSQAALEYATALARDSGATLLIMHVEDTVPIVSGEMYLPPTTFPNPELKKMLSRVVPADKQVPYEHILVLGGAPEEILRVAKDHDVDLIVMSTHGRTGFGRFMMGSVAEVVVRRATCPVLTLKGKHEAPLTTPEAAVVAEV